MSRVCLSKGAAGNSVSIGGVGAAEHGGGAGRAQQAAAARSLPRLPAADPRRRRMEPLRAVPIGADMRQRLLDIWPGLMLRKFDSDAANAACFGVERQTATYWRNGETGPNGAAVALAWLLWPGDMARLLGGAA
jgi:hypothetical protein